MLASHDRATKVDGHDAVECRLGNFGKRRVAAGNADPHIIMEHVDAAPASTRVVGHSRERRLFGNVRLEGDAVPGGSAGLPRHCNRFLGRGELVVDGEHLGPFLNEAKHRRTAIAHALARRLAGAHHNGDFVLKTHVTLD